MFDFNQPAYDPTNPNALLTTPADILRQRQMADALLKQGQDYSPVRSAWQGVARLAQGLLGGYESGQLDQESKAGSKSAQKALADMLLGNSASTPPMGASVGQTGSPARPPYGNATATTADGGTIPLPPTNPLGKLNPEFRSKFADLRAAAAERGVNFNAPEDGSLGGVRTQDQQDALYAQGRTAPGSIVTGTRDSNHITGKALDVVPTDGTSEKQVGSTVTDLINNDPRFAGLRSGATFKNLYDPLHVELNKPQGTQVASLDPNVGVGSGEAPPAAKPPVAAPPAAAAPAAPAPQASAQPPVQVAQAQAMQSPQIRAALAVMNNPYATPAQQQIASATLQKYIVPQTPVKVGEGDTLVDPITGRVVATGAPKKNVLPIGGQLVDHNGNVVAKNESNTLSDTAADITARQIINGDLSGLQNVGRGTQGDAKITAIKNRAAEILVQEAGMKPDEAAAFLGKQLQAFKASGVGQSAEARTGATREANLKIILNAAEAAAPAAIDASREVSRTGFVPLNKIIQAGQVMTSDPQLKKFGMANLQLAEHWARAMNPTGVMRESDRDMALHFLSLADSQKTYEQAVNQILMQIKRERDSIKPASGPSPLPTPATPAAKTLAPAAPKPGNYRFDPATGQMVPQ